MTMPDTVRRRLSPLLAQRGAVQQRTQPRRVPWADHSSMRPMPEPSEMLGRMLEADTRRREEYELELEEQRRAERERNQPAATERMAMIRRHHARQPTQDQIENRAFQMDAQRDALLKMQTAEQPTLPENPYDQEDEEL